MSLLYVMSGVYAVYDAKHAHEHKQVSHIKTPAVWSLPPNSMSAVCASELQWKNQVYIHVLLGHMGCLGCTPATGA